MRGFWNDDDGVTVVDILAIVLGLGTIVVYWRYGAVDGNFADIVVAAVLAAAGQKVGAHFVRRRWRNPESSSSRGGIAPEPTYEEVDQNGPF